MDEALRNGPGAEGALAAARLVQVTMYVNDLAASRAFYEDALGLELVGADEGSALYATGPARLRLRRADDELVTVVDGPDPSADLTFLVPRLDPVRDALAARGVELSETLRYVIGATTGFFDPDGHRISLYEPSAMAMTWPSGEKIRELLRSSGKDAAAYGAGDPPAGQDEAAGLGGSELVYLFLFVPDAEEAIAFYHGVLGLPYLECRACRRGSTEHEQGVVKYDAGGLMLTTHLYEGPEADAAGALDVKRMKGLSPVFRVDDVERVVAALAARGVRTGRIVSSGAGRTARFEDPFGRVLHLLEPAPGTGEAPDGERLAETAAGGR
jgi:catechol 2,3-dioxygenase-like lactoylglutathione lyase family enzyme